jgi:hypothetical protein
MAEAVLAGKAQQKTPDGYYDIERMLKRVRLRPSHTTVRTGPYTAVREVTLTRFDQGQERERFEAGIGESDREGFAPGEVPGSTAAAGHVAQLPRDSPVRLVPLADAVVFSIGARGRPAIASVRSE